jgi:hypothetical protein
MFSEWQQVFDNPSGQFPEWQRISRFEYFGDPQRNLREELSSRYGDSVIFAVEPVELRNKPGDDGRIIGYGLVLSVIAPKGFELDQWRVQS